MQLICTNKNGGINLKKYNGKNNLIKIAFFALMFFALAGCGGNDNDYYRDQYYRDQYYGDSYYSLIAELNRLSIHNLDDIADMVYTAWDYGAEVEVDFLDYHGYHIERDFINNDRMLESFIEELYYNEIFILDVEVLEEGFDLFLIFTVEIY